MNNSFSFRRFTLLAAVLLAVGLAPLAQAQKPGKNFNANRNQATEKAKSNGHHAKKGKHGKHATGVVGLLLEARHTLALADHDYDGHRVLAMKDIKAAIHDLNGNHVHHHVKKGNAQAHAHKHHKHVKGKHHGKGKEPEPQAVSDARLRTAIGLLQKASSHLSGNALQRVNSAISQLNTALSIR